MDIATIIGAAIIVLLVVVVILQIVGMRKAGLDEVTELLRRSADEQRDSVARQLSQGATEQFRRFGVIQESVQATLQGSREEQSKQMQEFRFQVDALSSGVTTTLQGSRTETNEQLAKFSAQLDMRLSAIQEQTQRTLQSSREEQSKQMQEFQLQVDKLGAGVTATLQTNRTETNEQLSKFSGQLDTRLSAIQEQTQKTLQSNREEQSKKLREFSEQVDARLMAIQRGNTENIEKVNTTLESRMKSLQESNEKRLEQMQGVVDEKLQKTLETRLAQSFELVSKQLESVGQGLGEMKALAADTKSLKNALINVKERGTYGEVRLEKLLEDILAPGQYDTNVEITGGKRVEFAIKLPGNGEEPLLLPIDSKFPIEDYARLLDAQDKEEIKAARKALFTRILGEAKDIRDKYISPPKTTDFALLFLPTEGLYAEVVQNVKLFEELRDKYKVTAVGATTLSAFLASLQMGFKTLAIEQRSQEVWDTLRSVKKQFGEFGKMLDQAHKQLQTADHTIEQIVGVRTRQINKALRGVEELTDTQGALADTSVEIALLELDPDEEE
ncbi:MAG: DNA recombination protein RmuC [Lachnospiraceae bacterium]|jgi:DNA recombination protein RmuC|nr:DNA recombination protein RmuC [Lachnospiraceae bacterium]